MKKTTELLRDLRIDHDLKQKDVAEILGTSQQYYSNYENGAYDLPLRHFITLVEYYQVSADYLLGRSRITEQKETDFIYVAKDFTATQLLQDVLSLDEADRRTLVEYLAFLKQRTNQ